MLTERICESLALAVQAHENQVRKGRTSIPYVAHPMGVASIALGFGADEDQAIAALLHDTLEDEGRQYGQMTNKRFGERVLVIVEGCTDGAPDASGQKADWGVRKRAYLDHLPEAPDDVRLALGSDKLNNARAIVSDLLRIGHEVFNRFSAGRDGTLWHCHSLAEIFMRCKAPMANKLGPTLNSTILMHSKAAHS